MDVFRVRLNCIDHYQAAPTKYDPALQDDSRIPKTSKEPKVPVIRVFGSTETGQKVCAHIHGAFPYLFIEYEGSLDPDEVATYIYRLRLSIDHALAVSYRRDVYGEQPRFVARITLVKAIPFYGFHVGYRFFLKIYMLNPIAMNRLADLLHQGLIMNRKFQPYEAHLQYLLQFMVDYNLYGCAYIETKNAMFRAPVPENGHQSSSRHFWHDESIPADRITEDRSLPRVSHCSIEVDICVQDILNRASVKERRLHHDFIERLHPIPPQAKLVHSMAGLWKDEMKRRRRKLGDRDVGSSPFSPEALVSMSADSRHSQSHGWIHEEEYRQLIQAMISEEDSTVGVPGPSFDTFVRREPLEDNVKTLLQSVEDLFPENLMPAKDPVVPHATDDPTRSIIVDEQGILELGVDDESGDFPRDSDEELVQDAKNGKENAQKERAGDPLEPDKISARETARLPQTLVPPLASINSSKANVASSDQPVYSSQDLGRGLCRSGLATGRLPKMPIYPELVAGAESDGLTTKMPGSGPSKVAFPLPNKHPLEDAADRDSLKRIRPGSEQFPSLDSAGSGTDLLSNGATERGMGSRDRLRQRELRPSQQKKASAKEHYTKPRAAQALKFTVVKDPDDPNTKLRLSQQSGSQSKLDASLKKQTSFDVPETSSDLVKSVQFVGNQAASPSAISSLDFSSATTRALSQFSGLRPAAVFVYNKSPPSTSEVVSTMREYGLPDVIYQDAFYGSEDDVPPRPREYAGREFRLESNTTPFLPDFDETGRSPAARGLRTDVGSDRLKLEREYKRQRKCTLKSWEYAETPPPFQEVQTWWEERQRLGSRKPRRLSNSLQSTPIVPFKQYQSQIEGPTPRNKHGFKYSQKQASTSVQHEAQYMSTMSLEVHVNTRGKLVPNPEQDEVQCIFWCIKSDEYFNTGGGIHDGIRSGIVVLSPDGVVAEKIRKELAVEIFEETSELDLMVRMVEIVRELDPDILTGFEVHGSSWGYLIERARSKYDYNLCDEFSRMKSQSHGRFGKEADRWGFNTTSTIRVTGRHMINIWRAMRGELNLLQYSMENVVWHLLHRRIPHYAWKTLTDWYKSGHPRDLAKVIRYYYVRTCLDIEILEANELIPRTSEQARLLGVDFFSVFSRGSQFKVESIMFRIAKPENFILVSPNRKQVGSQNALECLPLVMEPQSAFYSSPLLVLDFQSLYPSVMIAYNYCYSTFLGRIVNWRGMNKMGFTEYKRHQGLLRLLKDHINIAPNGMMYVKAEIRKSLLAKMLAEILETRVMVKSGMKQDKEDRTLQQLLNNRQLALKLLANVTYGYTSASFSGRMPCSEIADSIVQTGRETLERTIAFIHSVERWGAEVVYGDTDSLFVYLKGRTREQAFDIGNEIAQAVTEMNPRPIKLKFEKVYHPCVLLAKKRYVGYKYESRNQSRPEFDAKGIETVRRDGTPAEQKIEERALKLLFETADLSQVKAYFQAQCDKIMRGSVSVQDFCFAKEVKLGTYSDRGPPPPGALISTKRMLEDARAEPQYGERVPYVVITGAPGARLIDRCVAPEDLLNDPESTLDAEYYISKNIIPPLERIFNLVGANVRQWYDEMPKVQRIRRVDASSVGRKKTLESYLKSASCVICGVKMNGEGSICSHCKKRAPLSMVQLQQRLNAEEMKYADVVKVCQTCSAFSPVDDVPCDSKDCPVFYTRVKQGTRLRTEKGDLEPVISQLAQMSIRREALEW
ncbi:hypothetical protein VTK73DRAFT_2916 [Phialemonium thermophilum]|uniref:DNA polymerase n=1 Tax=Phialemonium thermophilum TaxID=223376 RepID=A0ABR3X2A5_9PEZI